MRRRRVAIGAAVVLAAGFAIAANADLHAPPRFDGAGYSILARSLIEGRGYREINRPDAPRHGHFPPGYPLVLAGLWSLTGRSVAAAHLLSIACTTAAAWLAWRWFRTIEPGGVADLLGMALAVNWTWGAVGGAIQSEPLYLLLSLLVIHASRARGWRASLGLGVLLGACVLTRHVGVCLLAAVVIDRLLKGSETPHPLPQGERDQEEAPRNLHPPPLRGRSGWGVAGDPSHALAGDLAAAAPHPNPPPQGGRGSEEPSPLAGEGGMGGGRAPWAGGWQAMVILLAALAVIAPWAAWLAGVRRDTQVGLLNAQGLIPRIASQAVFYLRRIPDALAGPFVEVATVFTRSRLIGLVATAGAAVVSSVVVMGWIRAVRDPGRRLAGLVPLVALPLLLVWPFTEAGRFLIPLVPFVLVGMVEGLTVLLGLFLRPTPHPNPPPQGGRGPDGGTQESGDPTPLWGRVGWGGSPTGSPRRLAALLVLIISLPYPTYAILTRRAAAQRRTHADFDAACAWISRDARRPGPVLTRHGGEVFWQTGRLAVPPASDEPDALRDQIRDQGVAYVLVDAERYANAPPTPLARLVEGRPNLARKVFDGPVAVYEVSPDSGP